MSYIPANGGYTSAPTPSTPVQELEDGIQKLSVKPKKKRSQRAYHSDFTSPAPAPMPAIPDQFRPPPQQGTQSSYIPATDHTNSYHDPARSDPVSATFTAEGVEDSSSNLSLAGARYYSQLEYNTPENGGCKSFLTFQNIIPPMAGTQFHAIDQGTASSKFIRPTMYNVPETEQLRAATKLPLAVTLRPFAPALDTEAPVPVVDMRQLGQTAGADLMDIGPPRCRRCRTYMNPAMQHSNHNTFVCNICQFPNNSVPLDYSSMLNPSTGLRLDREMKPELHRGVYDILVPPEYNVGGSKTTNHELHHIFLIDVSEQSVRHMLPTLAADAIRAALYSSDYDEEGTSKFAGKVAIITFDKRVQFYNLSPALETTQIAISADLDDPFIPFHDGLFVEPEESRMLIEDALNNLEALSNDDTIADAEPCFAAACRYALTCLETVGGGKITSILSTLPSWGPGHLKYKDNKAVGRTPSPEIEKKIFLPDNDYYKLLARDFLEKNVGLDVLVVCPLSVDLSNVGWLASVSGGSVYKWSNFNFERDGRTFTSKFVSSVTKTTGYQGQLKLRCSNGLQVTQYYGTSSSLSESKIVGGSVADPVVPVLSEDQTFTVLLEYDGKLNTKYDCHFQAAMLYTDKQGQRKVRVINLVLAVSERLEDVFTFVDQDSVVTTLVRDSLSFMGKEPLTELRNSINEKLVEIFTQYRAMSEIGHNRNRTLSNQLIFPESLKHLPLYMLAFLKTNPIRESVGISADSRLADMFRMLSMPVETLVYKLYPSLIELHSLADDECLVSQDTANIHKFIKVPQSKPLTAQSLDFGVYIMCDGDHVYVWVHQNSNILLVKDLFGEEIESVQQISPVLDELPELPTDISQQARNLVEFYQKNIIGSLAIGEGSIHVIREGLDPASEIRFRELLVEDNLKGGVATSSGPSYPDYLSSLHRAIRTKLDNDKSSHRVKDSISSAEHHSDTLAQRLIHF